MNREIARATALQLLGRRRTILLGLVAAIPILLAGFFRLAGSSNPTAVDDFTDGLFVGLVVTLLLPLVALVLGTNVFGAEIEDGTVIYLLAKPVKRWSIVLVKWLVAAAVAATLSAGATLLAGLLGLAGTPSGVQTSVGYAVAVAAGSVVYVAAFVALSLVTSRALVAGLIYVLVWEGTLANFFSGIRFLSIRQYTLGIADAVGALGRIGTDTLAPGTAVTLALLVAVIALVVAIRRLSVFQIPQAD